MSTERIQPKRPQRRDRGSTLPELLIVITLMGVIAAVIGTTITVSFNVARNSEGRVNLARAEQNIDIWLPADLASTNVKDTDLPAVELDPNATPCGACGSIDLSGVNALQLAWSTLAPGTPPVEVITRVQYQYINVGDEWLIQRIECVGTAACTVATVVHDLPAPDDVANYANVRPIHVFDVAAPDVSPDLDDNAARVVVTLNGGGDAAGTGGGVNTVSLTAGGRVTSEIDADTFDVPSFVRADSRCGGPISLLVDTSGSIPTGVLNNVVEPGVQAFINAFRDTPTQIQIIEFGDHARPMGPGSDWHKYVDMTDSAAVDALVAEAELLSSRRAGARTNWEDPFFRAFRNADGSVASLAANRVVFFTDGISTVHRRMDAESGKPADQFWTGSQVDFNAGKYNPSKWTAIINQTAVNRFNQEAFDRTDALLDQHRSTDMIFVGVGPDLTNSSKRGTWIQNTNAYVNPDADPAPGVPKYGAEIIQTLLGNGSIVVPAEADAAGGYTNPEVANYYQQDSFDKDAFAAAMRAAALKDCGGTLTIQTRLSDGSPVQDEFVYENTQYRDDTATPVDAASRRVTTSDTFKTGTFDFDISDSTEYLDVDVVPQELQTLAGYDPVGWTCRSGADPRTTQPVPIEIIDGDGNAITSPFEGMTVRVRANEAVSCILTVDPS